MIEILFSMWLLRWHQWFNLCADAGLRERLSKIMASDYFTTTPQMKEVSAAAAAGNYAPFQVPVHEPILPVEVPVQLDFQQKVLLI